MPTLTVYPEAGAGGSNTTCDGLIVNFRSGTSWEAVRNQTEGTVVDTAGTGNTVMQIYYSSGSSARAIARAFYAFDTSSLGADASITSAIISIWGTSKNDATSSAYNTCIVASTTADDNNLVLGDFDNVGATPLSNVKAYADFSVTGYNDYTLTEDGKGAISKDGISKFALRNKNYDIDNVQPPSFASVAAAVSMSGTYADNTGTDNDPKLVVEYSASAVTTNAILFGTNF